MGRKRVSEEHTRERKRRESKRREMTRIHLGNSHKQWAELRSLRKDGNVGLAEHLLRVHEHYCKSCRELRTGTISRGEDLHTDYDSRQDEVISRESHSVKVVNQNGQVYMTVDRDMQKSGTGNRQQQQQQHPQPSMKYQQNVPGHSDFPNKSQTTNSDTKISQKPGFMNQIPSGYHIGEVPPKHMNNGHQIPSNSTQGSSGVQNPTSVQTAQSTTMTSDNTQNRPDKSGVIQGNVHHVGKESSSGKHQVLVEKQLQVKEEPVDDDFVVIINPDDDSDDEYNEDGESGETTDTCDESEYYSEFQDKELSLVEVKEEPLDDYPDHTGHCQERSVECHRGLKTATTITNGTQNQPGNSRMGPPDGNPFSSSNTNTSPSLQEAIIEVVTCYRYGDLVNSHLTPTSNNVKDKQLISCDNLLKQIPQTGTQASQTGQRQTVTVDQENIRKRKHDLEEKEQTHKKTKHNICVCYTCKTMRSHKSK